MSSRTGWSYGLANANLDRSYNSTLFILFFKSTNISRGVKAKYYFKMLNTLTLDGSDISDE